MSSHTNCRDAVQNLYSLLDDELSPELKATVERHFEECPGCFPLYQFERSFCRFLRARVAAQTAPPELRRRVFERLLLENEPPDPSA
jgi:anti-sigma factor (TIGR02949 family)